MAPEKYLKNLPAERNFLGRRGFNLTEPAKIDLQRKGDRKMKKISVAATLVLVMVSFVWIDAAFAGRVKNRQVKQQKRIHQGIRSGELTKGEVIRLEKQQKHIQKSKRRAWSDGKLTPKERIRLEHKQDRASRRIYKAKHNENDRN